MEKKKTQQLGHRTTAGGHSLHIVVLKCHPNQINFTTIDWYSPSNLIQYFKKRKKEAKLLRAYNTTWNEDRVMPSSVSLKVHYTSTTMGWTLLSSSGHAFSNSQMWKACKYTAFKPSELCWINIIFHQLNIGIFSKHQAAFSSVGINNILKLLSII